MAHEAAICETELFFQPQLTWMSLAMPTPTSAPTIDWVVLTGKPNRVQTVSQVAEPKIEVNYFDLGTSEDSEHTDFSDNIGHD